MRHAPNLLQRQFARVAAHVAGVTGHPLTFMLSCVAVATWAIASLIFHIADTWQTVIGTSMTMGTFLMVFLIQNTQNRNSAAVQAKLDELIRALGPANNKFIGLENRPIEDVHELRQETDGGSALPGDLAATAGHEGDQRKPD
jgi:low affinity Fe/Cu permease